MRSAMLLAILLSIVGLAMGAPMRVVVTGAGGQTGGHVFRKMLARPDTFTPVGITRTSASRDALLADTGAPPDQVVVADVAEDESGSGIGIARSLAGALMGAAALVICTSAKVKPTGGTNPETGRPNMGFPDGQPFFVDWRGQRLQIDAARATGVGRVVICSSMGGTDANHMLNRFGRNADGSGGNILQWKRKAEKYLIDSGMTYTIVHPGGLLNEPGGRRELVAGIDDQLLAQETRSIPREDVAEVMVQSLSYKEFNNRSFDLVSKPDSGDAVQVDFESLLAPLEGGNCDYSLGLIPDDQAEQAEVSALQAAL